MTRRVKSMLVVSCVVCISSVLFASKGWSQNASSVSMPPTIENQTEGRIKAGDLITKENVDQVKEYLSLGVYECVKDGMVLRMGKLPPPDETMPKHFLEATEKNKGKAVINDHGVVTLADGSHWPGGIPFGEPKTGAEVMGDIRFGHATDNWQIVQPVYYVNKHGERYKTGNMRILCYYTEGRLKVPPRGVAAGEEKYHKKFINVFTYPLELKGLGQFNINHVDDTVNYDIGFAYLPAFKRTIRISSTTFQDNVGGSDFTYGDPQGLREPFGTWTFKLLEKKYLLLTEPIREKQPTLEPNGMTNPQVEWERGEKYPRLGWVIKEVYVVEARPKDTGHIYQKKIFYIPNPFFNTVCPEEIPLVDIYDRSGGFWKVFYSWSGGKYTHKDGEVYGGVTTGYSMHDMQSGHSTHFPIYWVSIDGNDITAESLSLARLLQLGR